MKGFGVALGSSLFVARILRAAEFGRAVVSFAEPEG